ncbi:hypothetical protein ONS95_002130 [Cadophora gregata]|uniref:uncharacterized protein n=1 Tax=Cadophora gregata TaxID=51156 RepID=UPI0026DB88C7|nr:uncharacterized protein ONS95_002130 [Cadophora gregata]KAK0109436.1 hypothetical protein ONS95_002130 [Cadophora gregata]KAK0110936.1 hypothetical protein ONS96_002521 [Cadophora gregata f. sp. sojae]
MTNQPEKPGWAESVDDAIPTNELMPDSLQFKGYEIHQRGYDFEKPERREDDRRQYDYVDIEESHLRKYSTLLNQLLMDEVSGKDTFHTEDLICFDPQISKSTRLWNQTTLYIQNSSNIVQKVAILVPSTL